MTPPDETRKIVEAYVAAWTTQKVREARALLAEDLAFTYDTQFDATELRAVVARKRQGG